MKRCGAKPYEGMEPYVFISYCHKDRRLVFPIIEWLARAGYRVWYDEGIDPGSEWPEVIAQHLNQSSICIACMTQNSVNSHNCRREVNFALLKRKPFLSIMLEKIQLSLGMEMQLSSIQSIFKYKLPDEAEFYKKLVGIPALAACKGAPDPRVIVSQPSGDECEDDDLFTEEKSAELSFSDSWFVGNVHSGKEINAEDKSDSESIDEQSESDSDSIDKQGESDSDNIDKQGELEKQPGKAEAEPEMEAAPETEDPTPEPFPRRMFIYQVRTDGQFELPEGISTLGRSHKQSSIVIADNGRLSRRHLQFIRTADSCVVMDCCSHNGTRLNGKKLEPETEYPLKDGDVLRPADEELIFHIE